MSRESFPASAAIENPEANICANHRAWVERAKQYGPVVLGSAMVAGFGALAYVEGKDLLQAISGHVDAGFLDYLKDVVLLQWATSGISKGLGTVAGEATGVRTHWENIVDELAA